MLRDFIKHLKLSQELVVIKKSVSKKFVAVCIPTHCEKDGGPYVTPGVVVAEDSELGRYL